MCVTERWFRAGAAAVARLPSPHIQLTEVKAGEALGDGEGWQIENRARALSGSFSELAGGYVSIAASLASLWLRENWFGNSLP